MINNFEIIIGIETHIVLNTKTKMFSNSINSHHLSPNTAINEIDLGLPGILPTPNPSAIKKAIWLGLALNSEINWKRIQFDRKNYFYLDLPKGFQITQQYFPIGRNGQLIVEINEQKTPIEIERFHLEEDTAKQIISDGEILLDYNRSGCPLIEIVTKPVIHSSQQAAEYLKKLIQILKFNNISDAKLEDGSMRADINVSVRPIGQKSFNKKVEIKNINSINNVIKAIEYEVDRQIKILLNNESVSQETRRFDEATNTTVFMREKTDAVNYFYFNDINIPIISLTQNEFEQIKREKNKDLDVIVEELTKLGFNKNNINLLINNYDLYKLFENINSKINEPNLCFNWITVELSGILNKNNLQINQLNDEFINEFTTMLELLVNQEINGKQAKIIFEKIFNEKEKVKQLIVELGFEQIKDVEYLTNLITSIMESNPEIISEYPNRPEKVQKFIIGNVMKETKSQANPKITAEIVIKMLDNKK